MNVPLVIVGCTASGKSDLAEALAEQRGATIMAVDSMQVYRGLDIGTAKPDAATRARIPHAMIDVADPWESYSAARFAAAARPILDEHLAAGRPLILIGGTILYLRALLEGLFEGPSASPEIRAELEAEAQRLGVPALHAQLAVVDPLAAERIHPNDLRRIVRALEVQRITGAPISTLQTQWNLEHPAVPVFYIGVGRERDALNRRINARVRAMLAGGLLEEVKGLVAPGGRGLSKEAASGVGYRQLLDHLEGRLSLEEAVEQIKIQTRHLAKLQRTWLKRFSGVSWLEADENQSGRDLLPAAEQLLTGLRDPNCRPT
ncbi:MAG: tRNA (adenosine(37)-N6)-dimethylallyltransferase MiaA [Phycisphaerae bacterium]